MLLVCPKCVAQYEVDTQAIPESGREVQCANCDHIWFQDQLQMFPDEKAESDLPDPVAESVPSSDGTEPETTGSETDEIFQDLSGVGDVEFHSGRKSAPPPLEEEPEISEEETVNILTDDLDEEEEYDDDPAMELPEGGLGIDSSVLEILRSEAAFSSTRINPEPVEVQDDEPQQAEAEAPVPDEPEAQEELDDLTAFLNEHLEQPDEVVEEEVSEIIEETVGDIVLEEDSEPESEFDPLSDLDAIRSQLDNIGVTEEAEEVEYQPILPQDDDAIEESEPQEEDISSILAKLNIDEPTEETPLAEYEATSDQEFVEDDANEHEVDDFEEYTPRRAFRTDGAGQGLETDDIIAEDAFETEPEFEPTSEPEDTQPVEEEAAYRDTPTEEVEVEEVPEPKETSVAPALAALGTQRPRANGSGTRMRTILGAEDLLFDKTDTAAEPRKSKARPLNRPMPEPSIVQEQPDEAVKFKPASRKDLLPDVEELNATLRGEEAKRQKDAEQPEKESKPAGKSFGRSFVITLLFLAVLIALYLLQPMIVSALPQAAIVLDPYVAFIDNIRLSIESLVGKYLR